MGDKDMERREDGRIRKGEKRNVSAGKGQEEKIGDQGREKGENWRIGKGKKRNQGKINKGAK